MPPSMISDKGVGGVSVFQFFKDNGEKGGCCQLISFADKGWKRGRDPSIFS